MHATPHNANTKASLRTDSRSCSAATASLSWNDSTGLHRDDESLAESGGQCCFLSNHAATPREDTVSIIRLRQDRIAEERTRMTARGGGHTHADERRPMGDALRRRRRPMILYIYIGVSYCI